MEATLLNMVVTVYLAMGFGKFAVCVTDLPTLIGVMSRLSGAERGKIHWRFAITIPLFALVTALIGWIPILLREGIHFFFSYSKYVVMRDCVRAYRHAHVND